MTLVYLYGPPASGKLTVASLVTELTGLPLFHNHLTVNAIRPVFPFGTTPFMEVLHRLRLDVFQTAAREGASLIFTNNSAWSGQDGRARFEAFAAEAEHLVAAEGGRTLFVQLMAPLQVLEERVAHESRRQHGKLVDPARLRDQLLDFDLSPLHSDDLVIDTSQADPDAAAHIIADALAEQQQVAPKRGDSG